jgi:hypothetical protein
MILFPMAERALDPASQERLLRQFAALEERERVRSQSQRDWVDSLTT